MASALVLDAQDQPTWRYRVEPFREAVDRSTWSQSEIEKLIGVGSGYLCKALGYKVQRTTKVRADGTRVQYQSVRSTISYELACKLALALDLDLVELGV